MLCQQASHQSGQQSKCIATCQNAGEKTVVLAVDRVQELDSLVAKADALSLPSYKVIACWLHLAQFAVQLNFVMLSKQSCVSLETGC